MKLSVKSPWQLLDYANTLVDGHNMSDLELEHRLAEIDAAIEESSICICAVSSARDAYKVDMITFLTKVTPERLV